MTITSPGETGWQPSPRDFRIADTDIHIWRIELDRDADDLAALNDILTPEEKAHSAAFRTLELRARAIVSRGMLRVLLGKYTGCEPEKIQLVTGPWGKPELTEGSSGLALAFNIAHSGAMALYAFCLDAAIGIDIELVRPDIDVDTLVSRYYSEEEQRLYEQIPQRKRLAAFYATWTRKEAVVKALGGGLSIPLDGFSVNVNPHEPARLLHMDDPNGETERWTLQDIKATEGYAGCAAIRARGRCWSQFLFASREDEFLTTPLSGG